MPHIATFMYSEAVHTEVTPQGPKTSINGPLIVFKPLFVPSMFSFAVSFGLLDVDISKQHTIRYTFKQKGNVENIIDTGDTPIPANNNPDNAPIEARGYVLNLDFRNVPLMNEGYYESEVFLDGTSLGTFPIYVKGVQNK